MSILKKIVVFGMFIFVAFVGSCGRSVTAQAPEELQLYLSNINIYTHINEKVKLPNEVFYSFDDTNTFGKMTVIWEEYSDTLFEKAGTYKIEGRTEVGSYLVEGYIHVYNRTIVVSAIGDSLTAGSGLPALPSKNGYPVAAYPTILENMLESGYEVLNYGVSGATLSNFGTKSYRNTEKYKASVETEFDAVVIQLGTNDNQQRNWSKEKLRETLKEQYISFIDTYAKVNKDAAIYLCLVPDASEKTQRRIAELLPEIIEAAKASEANITIVDQYTETKSQLGTDLYQADQLHLSERGAELLAKNVYEEMTGN